jgi:hypothetical protein
MHFTKLAAVTIFIAACSAPAQNTRQEPSPTVGAANQTTPGTYATTPVMAPAAAPAAGAPAAPPRKNQPPHIKLKLGHYTSGSAGIGMVIDMTEMTDNVADIDPVKVRFDGDNKVYRLKGQYGPRGRIDYVKENGGVLLHAWDDGRRSVYVPDPDTGRASEEIHVYRDADADPL